MTQITLPEALERFPGAQTFRFGDNADLSAELLALVWAGRKRATCYAPDNTDETPPVLGRIDIALDWHKRPALAIRTLELRRVRFNDMTEEMALMEGENDTLDGWRAGHEAYYRRAGIFDPEMWLVWERFELVEDFGNGDAHV